MSIKHTVFSKQQLFTFETSKIANAAKKKWVISVHIPRRSICQLPIGHMAVGVFQHVIIVPLCEGSSPVFVMACSYYFQECSSWHEIILQFS